MQVHRSIYISNWIWALNVQDDSLSGCKVTGAYQQVKLSSECPGWHTPWMQVHRSISTIEFELWMSRMTHYLDASSQEHISNWIWAQNVHGDSPPGCQFTTAHQQLNLEHWWGLTSWMWFQQIIPRISHQNMFYTYKCHSDQSSISFQNSYLVSLRNLPINVFPYSFGNVLTYWYVQWLILFDTWDYNTYILQFAWKPCLMAQGLV